MERLYELALFAGGGGGLLGSKLLGWRTICYVENGTYAIEIIKARIRDGMLDDAPIWDDARTFDGKPWAGCVDIVSAGFPCQPWSAAGKHKGEHDERNLWPDTIRIIREVGPEWCLLENVPNLLSRSYIQQIFIDLAESGYDARWDCIPAAAIGAPHIRNRLWIVANNKSGGKGRLSIRQGGSFQEEIDVKWNGEDVSNSNCFEYEGDSSEDGRKTTEELFTHSEHDSILLNQLNQAKNTDSLRTDRWFATEPEVGRVVHGVAHRVDRIRAIGNGQVPGVVRAAWMLLARDIDHD